MKREKWVAPATVIIFGVLFSSCSWPKVKVGGDEYLLSPIQPGTTMTAPGSTSGSGSGTGASGVKPPK